MKKFKILAVTGLLMVIGTSRAFAAQWNHDQNGWWYQYDNGGYPVTQWSQIDGAWYYFEDSGYMVANTWVGDYYLGENGAMLTDTVTPDGYHVGADGKWIPNVNQASGDVKSLYKTYCNSNFVSGTYRGMLEDITQDGIDDLIVVKFETSPRRNSIMHVLTVQNGKVKEIHTAESPNFRSSYFIATVEGKKYLLQEITSIYQGSGQLSYSVYSLNNAGDKITFAEREVEIESLDDSSSEEKKFDREVEKYKKDAVLIMNDDSSELPLLSRLY